MRPGNMPGMPELGVNIGQYVPSENATQLDTNLLKGLIMSNCEAYYLIFIIR